MRSGTPWNKFTRLSIEFSHLKENKFRHDFEECIETICNSGNGPEATNFLFFLCANFDVQKQTVFDKITSIDDAILAENENCTAYIVISVTSVMVFVLSTETT